MLPKGSLRKDSVPTESVPKASVAKASVPNMPKASETAASGVSFENNLEENCHSLYNLSLQNTVVDNPSRFESLPLQYPGSVNPKEHLEYEDYKKDGKYVRLPDTVAEPVYRRTKLSTDSFPGPIIINGREEFYVEAIYQQVEYADEKEHGRAFVVIWAGWPTT